jgi:hypothetical protein
MSRQISLSDDTYHLSPIIDDRQPPNLMARHLPQAFPDGIVGVTGESSVGHKIGYNCVVRVRFIRYETHGNVAIRQYPNEAAFRINYRKRAEVVIAHQARRITDPILGVNRDHVARHQVACAHVIHGVPGTPVISLSPASLVFILIPAAPPIGVFITEP